MKISIILLINYKSLYNFETKIKQKNKIALELRPHKTSFNKIAHLIYQLPILLKDEIPPPLPLTKPLGRFFFIICIPSL